MTHDEMRIAVAEWRGFVEIHNCGDDPQWRGIWWGVRADLGRERQGIPDYPNDQNAMWDIEESASLAVIKAMRFWLWGLTDQMTAHHATAAQRCEAFLKAVGKWKEPACTPSG